MTEAADMKWESDYSDEGELSIKSGDEGPELK